MKYLIKRSLRDIRNNLTQFISIVIIIAVGSMVFSGLFATTRILRTWLDDYYHDYRLADQWIYVKGLSESEIRDAQSNLEDTKLEGRYRFQVDYTINGKNTTIRFHNPTAINQLKIMEGSDELANGKILVDQSYADTNGLKAGSMISFTLDEETFDFEISGLFESPEYAYKSKDFADAASAKQQFGIIYASTSTLIRLNRHGEIYKEAKTKALEEFQSAETELSDAKKLLNDKQTELDQQRTKATKEFARQQQIIDENRNTLRSSAVSLEQSKISVANQLSQLLQQYDQINLTIATLQQRYDTEYEAYILIRSTLTEQQQIEQDAYFTALSGQIQSLTQQATSLFEQYNTTKTTTDAQFAASQQKINQSLAQLEAGQSRLTNEKKSAFRKLSEGQDQIDEALIELQTNTLRFEEEKAKALNDIEEIPLLYFEVLVDGKDAQTWIDTLKTDDTFVRSFDQASFPGVTMISNVLSPIRVVSDIFPLLFFIAAAVIILISMSKNVENDRTQIAVMMALGYPRRRIMLVYLFYGWWAALLGSLGFALLGNRFIPAALLSIFTIRFSIPQIPIVYYPEFVLISAVLSLFFASIAILMALRHVLREIPAAAMRPKAPKNARNSFLERFPKLWGRFHYDTKLIIRNLLMGQTKLLLSSIGVVGALTLLIMGLSLRYSATNMIDQSIQSFKFEYALRLKEPVAEIDTLKLPIETSDLEKTKTINATLSTSEDTIQLNLIEKHSDLLVLHTSDRKPITMLDNTVIIPKSMQIVYGLHVNDSLVLEIDDQLVTLKITHVNSQYLGKNVYISFGQAEKLGLDTETDRIFVSNSSKQVSESEIQQMLADKQVLSVDTKQNMIDRSREILTMLNRIILIIIVSAAILSITVLFNLASINIFERQRELATLRVLGYTRREVQRLIDTENRVLALLGTVGGVPLGIFLFGWIADLVSTPDFIMSKEPNLLVILISIVMLFGFMEFTNLLLRGKVTKIKLVESLKGVE